MGEYKIKIPKKQVDLNMPLKGIWNETFGASSS